MKLINLIVQIVGVAMNVIYYLIASPVLVPMQLYRWNKNRKWRKSFSIGDECFFVNMFGSKSYGKIEDISPDRLQVRVVKKSLSGSSSGWYEVEGLRIV